MNNDRNARIAQALEPEPLDSNHHDSLWGYQISDGVQTRVPAKFDTDENAWRLAWSRLTEDQKSRMFARIDPLEIRDWYTALRRWANSTLAERCDWMLAVLKGT